MIGIVMERSYADMPEKILYQESTGFANTIKKLTEIKEDAENACILVDLDEVIQLFQNFHVLKDEDGSLYFGWGSAAFIENPQEFIHMFEDTELGSYKSDNVWKAWLTILRGLNETIREFYRYGAKDTDGYIMFLKYVLMFLSYMYVYDHKPMRADSLPDDFASPTGLFYNPEAAAKDFKENIWKKARGYKKD